MFNRKLKKRIKELEELAKFKTLYTDLLARYEKETWKLKDEFYFQKWVSELREKALDYVIKMGGTLDVVGDAIKVENYLRNITNPIK